jgi:hypothetical protein
MKLRPTLCELQCANSTHVTTMFSDVTPLRQVLAFKGESTLLLFREKGRLKFTLKFCTYLPNYTSSYTRKL